VIPVAANEKKAVTKGPHQRTAALRPSTNQKGGETQIMQTIHDPARGAPHLRFLRTLHQRVFATCHGTATAVEGDVLRRIAFAFLALLLAAVALSVGANAALAQAAPGGGGDAIGQTLDNVRNYLAGLAFRVGGIGFVISLLVKAYASINENMHAYAHMGMKGSLVAVVVGGIVGPVLNIAQGLAAAG
jgi:hypothetical protein